jgi:hypothetical protein
MVTASWQRVGFGPSARGLFVLLVAVAAVGCKSGSSWTAKPSWWTFGGSGDDPAKLAAAPPASTDVTKPSAAAKPYPTTTTPEGYVMENAQRAGQGQVATAAAQAPTTPATEPAVVTYGSKPVTPAPTAPPQIASAPAGAGSLSGIAPQVGPYSAPPAAAPVEQTLPSAAAIGAYGASASAAPPSGFGAPPQVPPADPAGVRVADARGADSWAAAPTPPPAATGDSRYAASTGSRFGGAAAAPPPQAAPASAFPPITPAAPATLPGAVDPLAAPAVGPTAAPSSLAPPTPTRRPDPGYRPGGTSSYRPSRTILAGDSPREPGTIQPVSFEMPANEGR